MDLKYKKISFDAGRSIVFLNEYAAKSMDIHPGDRLELIFKGKKEIGVVDTVNGLISKNQISFSDQLKSEFDIRPGDNIRIKILPEPKSSKIIAKKMQGKVLTKEEIFEIIRDIANNALTEAEVSYFVLGVYDKGMSFKETLFLTEAMYKTGQVIRWPKDWKVADKHCIGGIPGNRTTPLVVSICAAAGVKMPKTSSGAITSAAGTADTIESLAKVDLDISDLRKIVSKTGAC